MSRRLPRARRPEAPEPGILARLHGRLRARLDRTPLPAATGPRGEALVRRHLLRRGWKVIAHDLRTRHGQIDLLVRHRGLLVAVEVKTRRDHRAPARTVDPAQLARLERAVRAVAACQRPLPDSVRVDVVGVHLGGGEPELHHQRGVPHGLPAARQENPSALLHHGPRRL